MAPIRLLAVENTLTRKKSANQQILLFLLQVDNLSYQKQVDVLWCGRDGVWHRLPAKYQAPAGGQRELWQARLSVTAKSLQGLPGDIGVAVRLRCEDKEFWDNNQGWNHQSLQGSGVVLYAGQRIQNLAFKPRLDEDQQYVQVRIALDPELAADSVILHWTGDKWRHTAEHKCQRNKRVKRHGAQLWTARLKVADLFALEYCICCRSAKTEIWENNGGLNFRSGRDPLRVMILNLHCYQESRQDYKFSQIARAIDQEAADLVCLQEVAEHWNDGHGDWASNAANIINQRLKQPMHLFTDWSHLGFDKYREGVAILSRYPFRHTQARYVSDSHDAYSIHSRKVVMTQVHIPYIGPVNVFSAHLSWWEDGFQHQFQRLSEWADGLLNDTVKTNLLCGDFNITAGTTGYRWVVDGKQYEDQYLAANHQGLFEQIFRVRDLHWGNLLAEDYRIDYIFMNKDSALSVTSARVLFTEGDYGPVSDHVGFLMSFEPR
jgi:maltose 6'-phosphate phosphatase